MHRFRGWCFGGALLLALAGMPAPATEPADDLPSVAQTLGGAPYRGLGIIFHSRLVSDWNSDLVDGLRADPPDVVIAQLAKKYHLSRPVGQDLARIWILLGKEGGFPLPDIRLSSPVHDRLLSLVRDSGYAPLPLAVAYRLLEETGCRTQDFADLLQNAPDPATVAWQGMVQTKCYSWWLYARQHFPELEIPSLWLSLYRARGAPDDTEVLILTGMLLRPGQMRMVPVAERIPARTSLILFRLRSLLDLGLSKEAVALYDGAPPEVQAALRGEAPDGAQRIVLHVAGRAIAIGAPVGKRLLLAGAMYLVGERDRAAKLFDTLPKIAAMRRYGTCRWVSGRKCEDFMPYNAPQMAVLDGLLHPGKRTPYQIAESYFFERSEVSDSGVEADLNCAYFTAPGVRPMCSVSRSDVARQLNWHAADRNVFADMLRKADPQTAAVADAAIRRYAPQRASAAEIVPAFKALPLPAAFAGHVPPAQPYKPDVCPESDTLHRPLALQNLPEAFRPLRWAVNGRQITVVSAAKIYDKGFCITRGGFWVNRSENGGKSWQRPLYTGLLDMLPYQIVTDSKMPLVAGNALNIEVDKVSLAAFTPRLLPGDVKIDHEATGFYLHIPFSELRRDSDRDGIPDLAETRLLLDPHNPDSDGDGIVDGADAMPNVKAGTGTALARALIGHVLQDVYKVKWLGTGRVPPFAAVHPMMVFGRPADFSGLRPAGMLLVYPDAARRRINPSYSLSFPVLGPVIRNRAGTRGFLSLNSAAFGCTMRARRVHGSWQFDRTPFRVY